MVGVGLLATTTSLFCALGALELGVHRRRLSRIRYRIHVNGTRGKSSVTRLIAAGLREGGMATVAKTTGTLPRLIFPDGRELPIFRAGRPNVREQMEVVALAASCPAEALVVECMALQPALQWLCEDKLICATHGVITNARPDHLDVMGPTERDVAYALCGMVPRRGYLFTAERTQRAVLKEACDDRRTQLLDLDSAGVPEPPTDQEMSRFVHAEHADNVAVALAVCAHIGVQRDVAFAGMVKGAPDPGALTHHDVNFFGRRLVFVNGFAANDPVSTERIWRDAHARYKAYETSIAVFNCRADRPERSVQLGQAYHLWPQADYVVLMGSGSYLFARAATAAGLEAHRMVFADAVPVADIFELLVSLTAGSAFIMGLGNIGELGLPLVQYFKNRAQTP